MRKTHIIALCIAFIVLVIAVAALLIWNGVIQLNAPSKARYPVRGVDVSAYQGEIDWDELSSQGISFAFIKATEGSTFVDKRFEYNYRQAQSTPLRIGAYHFFSYDSPGGTQADNFIRTVSAVDNMLPPVVDLEFYNDYDKHPPAQAEVRRELDAMIEKLEAHYGMKPIIYATEKSYKLYLAGAYAENDIWIRNVIFAPRISDGRSWTFWQYSNRMRLKGYHGEERFIDMNAFNGTDAEFYDYAKKGM